MTTPPITSPTTPTTLYACPTCGKGGFKNLRAMHSHARFSHGITSKTPEAPQITLADAIHLIDEHEKTCKDDACGVKAWRSERETKVINAALANPDAVETAYATLHPKATGVVWGG